MISRWKIYLPLLVLVAAVVTWEAASQSRTFKGTHVNVFEGNVGIGINAPSSPLEVFGAAKFQGDVEGVLLWNPDTFAGLDFAGAELYLMGAQLILTTNPATSGLSTMFIRGGGAIFAENQPIGLTNYFSSAGVGNAHVGQTFDILQGPNNNVDATWRFGTLRQFGPTTSTQNLASAGIPISNAWFNTLNTVGTGPGKWELYGTNASSYTTISADDNATGVLINTNHVIITNRVLNLPSGGLQVGPSGAIVTNVLSASASLNFPDTLTLTSSDLPITVTGCTTNDTVQLGTPFQAVVGGGSFSCFTSNGAVWVRFSNNTAGSINPDESVFPCLVFKRR